MRILAAIITLSGVRQKWERAEEKEPLIHMAKVYCVNFGSSSLIFQFIFLNPSFDVQIFLTAI